MFHQVGSFEFGARSSSNRQCRCLLETSDAALDVHVYHVSNCPPRAVLRTQLHAYFTTAIHRQTASRGQIGSSRRLAQARARASRAQAVAHDVLHQRRQGQALDVVHALEKRAGRARGRRRAQHRAAHLRAHRKTRQPDGASPQQLYVTACLSHFTARSPTRHPCRPAQARPQRRYCKVRLS